MRQTRKGTGSLQPNELKAVYGISRVVSEKMDIDEALTEIVSLARPVFIFDNAILYLWNKKSGNLEPAFARAIGRGRKSESDISWGEKAAQKAFSTGKIYLDESKPHEDIDRLEQGFYLGQPMIVGGNIIGALIFIRFGGPTFTDDQINLAEFISAHVTQVLEHQRLVKKVANLEAEKRLVRLQSDFLATVSHELKTPLGFIKGYSTSLLRKNANWSQEEQKEFLEVIDEESDHMSELVENLLDSSRLQSGTLSFNFAKTDLNLLISEVIMNRKRSDPDLEIVFDRSNKEINVQGDALRIVQVLENLINNSFKYAPGSKVDIALSENEAFAKIQVMDFGPGIPDEHIGNIFKRFFRVPVDNQSVRGSGLGLYISQQIIHAHSGHMKVISEINKGTRFVIEIPKELDRVAV